MEVSVGAALVPGSDAAHKEESETDDGDGREHQTGNLVGRASLHIDVESDERVWHLVNLGVGRVIEAGRRALDDALVDVGIRDEGVVTGQRSGWMNDERTAFDSEHFDARPAVRLAKVQASCEGET